MIKTIVLDIRRCPVLICDGCGLGIEEASDGLVILRENGAVEFRHKSHINVACDVPGEGWLNIDVFLFNLIHNLKVDMDSAARSALMLDRLGAVNSAG